MRWNRRRRGMKNREKVEYNGIKKMEGREKGSRRRIRQRKRKRRKQRKTARGRKREGKKTCKKMTRIKEMREREEELGRHKTD